MDRRWDRGVRVCSPIEAGRHHPGPLARRGLPRAEGTPGGWFRSMALLAPLLAMLEGCQTGGTTKLSANLLACRSPDAVRAIGADDPAYQRLVDDALAAGRCAILPAGQGITRVAHMGGLMQFVDPASGRTYWADRRTP